jgi:hypothetical protein
LSKHLFNSEMRSTWPHLIGLNGREGLARRVD